MSHDFEPAASTAVAFHNVSKTFGSFYALRGLEIEFEAGRIHALVGQNGAGKSTCLGLLSGRITPSTGSISAFGKEYPQGFDARTASAASIATVYQELSLFPEMTAIENVFIGRLGSPFGFVSLASLRPRYEELCAQLRVSIDPRARVRSLSLANQQMLEIMRGLALRSRILLLDEPTAVLAAEERLSLFQTMRDLRDSGVTIIFVSHFLEEVLEISDTVTVFRNGELIKKDTAARWDKPSLVESMLGEEAAQLEAVEQSHTTVGGRRGTRTLLEVTDLSVGKLSHINLTVGEGEIVGIGGLVGSGRSTLLRALAGAQTAHSGSISLAGTRTPLPRSPRHSWKLGIGYIPEERKTAGLALERSSSDNIVIGDLSQVSRLGWVRKNLVSRAVERLANRFGIPPRLLGLPVGQLSGGNQQKVLFARWGLRSPRLLLADESTRGVDIGAKGQIMQMLREMADGGMGVIFVSSDLEEVAAVSDRIYVFSHGRIVGELDGTERVKQEDILRLAFGIGQN